MALKQKSIIVIAMTAREGERETGSIKNSEVPVHMGNGCRLSCPASSIAAIVELSKQRGLWILKEGETVYEICLSDRTESHQCVTQTHEKSPGTGFSRSRQSDSMWTLTERHTRSQPK